MSSKNFLNKLLFFYKSSEYLQRNDISHLSIKSDLLIKCCEIASEEYNLPNDLFGTGIRCQSCQIPWKYNRFKFVKRKTISKNSRRKLKKIALNKNGLREEAEITKAKNRLFKKALLIKCLLCNQITEHVQHNPEENQKSTEVKEIPTTPMIPSKDKGRRNLASTLNTSLNLQNQKTPTNTPSGTPSSARKRKQRDKFAGLNKMACLSSTPKSKDNPLMLLMRKSN